MCVVGRAQVAPRWPVCLIVMMLLAKQQNLDRLGKGMRPLIPGR